MEREYRPVQPPAARASPLEGSQAQLAQPSVAWGGIGGSGRHAAEIMAELAKDPTTSRALDLMASQRSVQELLKSPPSASWGGIGGSGRHAEEITPERG
jgi:hypothetical protein